jgi:hypothetical protein
MKLVFFKENGEIKLKLNQNRDDEEFNYVKLIEFLHNNHELEATEYCEDITENEKEKIDTMIEQINQQVVKFHDNNKPSYKR